MSMENIGNENLEKKKEKLVSILAIASHDSWVKQAHRDKGMPLEKLPKEVTSHDIERAEDILSSLETAGYKIVPK